MISQTNQRVAILIDTANLYHTARHVYRSKVHFESLVRAIANGRSITRAVAYTITSDNATENAFLDTLVQSGIEVRTKPLITYRTGIQKADWDVGITVDAISLAPHVDCIVIVSGDGDFAPLMRQLRALGVRAEAAAFDQSVSQMLLDVVDNFHDLSTMTDTILINARNPIAKRQDVTEVAVSVPVQRSVTDTRITNTPKDSRNSTPNNQTASYSELIEPKVNRQNAVRKNIISGEIQPKTAVGRTVAMTAEGTHEPQATTKTKQQRRHQHR